ncbi:hypothetical protein AGMMS4952_05700 [Spirochaetia bacterium]|nr:hypothetical protein AGMMS4952_05700 [Spirochaetia bacterium]
MTLYHGSNTIVETPDLTHTFKTLDFGKGFYTTSNKRQAVNFTLRVIERHGGKRILNTYNFEKNEAYAKLEICIFEKADKIWLDFVAQNRQGVYKDKKCDIIYGPVADDRVYQTLILYSDGIFTTDDALKRLAAFKLYSQYVFTSEEALKYLHFINSEEITEVSNGENN